MRKANLRTMTLTIKGEEITIPKPPVKHIVKLEDRYMDFATGTVDEEGMVDELLKMIPTATGTPYTREDFVKYNQQTVTIRMEEDNGDISEKTIVSNEVTYDRYRNAIKTMGADVDRWSFAEAFITLCGEPADIIDLVDYESINDCAVAFGMVFDGGELDALVEELSKFRK